jgi:hypothetical protein
VFVDLKKEKEAKGEGLDAGAGVDLHVWYLTLGLGLPLRHDGRWDRTQAPSLVMCCRVGEARPCDRTLLGTRDRTCKGCVRSRLTYADAIPVGKQNEHQTSRRVRSPLTGHVRSLKILSGCLLDSTGP